MCNRVLESDMVVPCFTLLHFCAGAGYSYLPLTEERTLAFSDSRIC